MQQTHDEVDDGAMNGGATIDGGGGLTSLSVQRRFARRALPLPERLNGAGGVAAPADIDSMVKGNEEEEEATKQVHHRTQVTARH